MQASRIYTSLGYSSVLHLAALTIALCVALALMAFTTPAAYAATTQHVSIQAADTMARGGGGGGHGGGGHGGESGAHGSTSHSGDENTGGSGGSGNNYRGHSLPFSHTGTSSGQGGDDSVQSLLITLAVVVGVIALIIYLNWRRVRLQQKS